MLKKEKSYRNKQRLYLKKYKITQTVVATEANVSDKTVRNYLQCISNNASVDEAIVKLVKAARLAQPNKIKQVVESLTLKQQEMEGEKNPKIIPTNSSQFSQEYKFAQ